MYHKKRKQFSLACFVWLFYQIQKSAYFFAWLLHQIQKSIYLFAWLLHQIQKSIYFFAWSWRCSERSHVASLFTDEEQKKSGSPRISNFCHTCRSCLWRRWYTAVHTETTHTVVVWQQPTSIVDKEEETWSEHVLQVFVALVTPPRPLPSTPIAQSCSLVGRSNSTQQHVFYPSIYSSADLSVCLSVCLSV